METYVTLSSSFLAMSQRRHLISAVRYMATLFGRGFEAHSLSHGTGRARESTKKKEGEKVSITHKKKKNE